MKIMHEQVSFAPRTMLKVKWDDFPHFTYPWHFHGEFEIVYVLKSSGKRFVADSVEPFGEGDICMVGPNLPHFWESDIPVGGDRVNAIVVQFSNDLFREEIGLCPEFHHIKGLLSRAERGINFQNPACEEIGKMLKRLLKLSGLERMLYFIKTLDVMGRTESYRILASKGYQVEEHKEMNSRLDKVLHYITTHYQQKITQQEVASKIGMATAAFCRYFKERTGKGFVYFVNEMRIGHACKLLIDGHLSITQVCFECGFNNLSNFNRQFKRQTGHTPGEYQEIFARATKSNT